MNNKTITAAFQISNSDELLNAYRKFCGNNAVVSDDLFAFLTTPAPEREEFLTLNCTCDYSSSDTIIISTYALL